MKKFQNKYRIPSARLQSWDYGSDGYYFITICTAHMEHYFGEIHDGEMIHNELGKIADKYWEEIPVHFPFVELGNYVVMPNHVHGILIIDKPNANVETPKLGVSVNNICEMDDNQTPKLGDLNNNQTPKLGVSTAPNRTAAASEKWNPGTIGVIVNQYKRAVTINIRQLGYTGFAWRSRFHDHIIRDAQSFENIQNYIENNPQNWDKDKFNQPIE